MQEKLSEGTIGRVLVDRNTAFYFLDKSGLKKNRQIRMIRNIDYPMDYYLAHVYTAPVNVTNDTDPEIVKRKKVVECGPALKEYSTELRGESKKASGDLIPAELQVVSYNTYELKWSRVIVGTHVMFLIHDHTKVFFLSPYGFNWPAKYERFVLGNFSPLMMKERLQSCGTPSSTVIRRFSLVSYPLTPRVN